MVATSIPCLWRGDEGEPPRELSPSPSSSPLSLSVSFSCHCIRHHERFTALLLTNRSYQPNPSSDTHRHNAALIDLSLSRKTMQEMEYERTKVLEDGRDCVPVRVLVRACRLGVQRFTRWRALWAPEWACDVWQMTDSINFLPRTPILSQTHMSQHRQMYSR